jgi:L-alanine-DL-glutamate epimerase-like enolase superfamily enzyme
VERIAAVRAAAGPGVSLRLDLNGTLATSEAESVLSRLEAFHLEYVEQPVAEAASVADLARLRRLARVPIAADESVTDLAAGRALLDADAVDAVVVKPARVGGVGEGAALVELAAQAGVPVTVSTLLETGVGLAGALQVASLSPGDVAHGLATAGLLATDLLASPLTVVSGRMAVLDGPGLGVEVDDAAVMRWGET